MFRTLKDKLVVLLGIALAPVVSLPAWAQQQGQMTLEQQRQFEQMMGANAQEMEAFAIWLQAGINVFMLIVFGVILLIAKRDMKGWNQPIKWVWFSFSGRLNRKAYWLKGVVALGMINTGIQVFGLMLMMVIGTGASGAMFGGITLLVVMLPLMVFQIWVSLALSAKRFHDLGSSAWWILGFLIPFYNLWLAIKLLFFRGTPGPNAFGSDPVDEVEAYIDEMTGGQSDDEDGEEPVIPHPRPPENGPQEPQGFGARKFSRPVQPEPQAEPEPVSAPTELPGGSANLDVIKRRLGDDIMRPIQRKGGGGRDAEG
ncbi:MAG: DUF805 domain-containing protein [Magnetovibrio sp.]|nr:DUF805 domain-containing protein [Magnetovibrio sp.]